jgi:hypothetical protein
VWDFVFGYTKVQIAGHYSPLIMGSMHPFMESCLFSDAEINRCLMLSGSRDLRAKSPVTHISGPAKRVGSRQI